MKYLESQQKRHSTSNEVDGVLNGISLYGNVDEFYSLVNFVILCSRTGNWPQFSFTIMSEIQ